MVLKERVLSVLTTIFLILVGSFFLQNNNYFMQESIEKFSKEILKSQSVVLERSISRSTASAKILGKHIQILDGNMSDFEIYAKELYLSLRGVTNIQLAPNGVVSKIYPLDGHEKAIGHDIFKKDDRRKEAFLAKNSKKLTLAGPFTLIQGGVAIIARNPIYINKNNKEEFWGFSSALILLEDLIKTTELTSLKEENYLYRLRRIHPDTQKIEIFAGDKEFPNKNIFTRSIEVPNGIWYLDIEYIGSYLSNSITYLFYFLFLVFSIVMGYLVFIILKRPRELKELNKVLEKRVFEQTSLIKHDMELISKYIIYSKTNTKAVITEVSDAFCKISGYSREELIGQNHNIVRHPDNSKQFYQDIWNCLLKDEPWGGEIKNLKKDGSSYWIYADIRPEYHNNKLVGYIAIRQDITSKKKFEKQQLQLIEQRKMASLGEMIGNIAHQWRQPLNVISTAATSLKLEEEMKILEAKDIFKYVDLIVKNTMYLSETIDTFRNFIKEKKELVIQERINIALKILENTLKNKNIKLINNIDYNTPIIINIFVGEFAQVLINIITNAKDIIEEKQIKKPWIKLELLKDDKKVTITIEDNAGGIPSNILNKIFEPYFTTKHGSRGTGLGLYMSYKIVSESLKGKLYVKNSKNGAKFFIELPLNENEEVIKD